MDKKLILGIVLLLIIPLALTLDECAPEVETFDLPCRITSTYQLPNPCNTYNLRMYKDNISLDIRVLEDFGIYCTTLFNYTGAGSYYHNSSTGETGGILVKEKMQQFYNFGVYGFFLLVVLVLIVFMHKFKEDKGTPVVYGTIAGTLCFIMVAIMLSGFQIVQGITFIIDVNYYIIALTAGIGFYTFIIAYFFYGDIKEEENTKSEMEHS